MTTNPKPCILGVETAVTDLIYRGGDEVLKQQFFDMLPSLLDESQPRKGLLNHAPRAGDNILIPAEAFEAALLLFGQQHGLITQTGTDDTSHAAAVKEVRTALFGAATMQAGGSLANSFDAMVHSTLNGESLVDGTFITAVGNDESGRAFEASLAGHIKAVHGGKHFVAHIIPTGKDRIIIATPSAVAPCDRFLNADMLNDPAVLNAGTDMVMLGGYLFYTPHFQAVFDTALSRIEALNIERKAEGKNPIKLVLTCAAQAVAAHPDFRAMMHRAACTTDTIIHANTGEFRRLLDLDTEWRKPFDAEWEGLEGAALESAKKGHEAYQAAKADANQVAIHRAEVIANMQARPTGDLPGHRTTRLQFVVTNGARGIYVVDADEHREYETAKIDPASIVNTVGAGDNFAGGYELGVALGRPEAQSIELAKSFAAAVIQQDPPRLAATLSCDYSSTGKTLQAGGALATLPDQATSKILLEKLVAHTPEKGI